MSKKIPEEITFRKLEIFLAYMSCGNMEKAADELEISRVSVHRALHSLEDAVGCALFLHEGRNLVPTKAANLLGKVAAGLIEHMSDGLQSMRETAGLFGDNLRVGSIISLTANLLPRMVTDMKSRRPTLNLELVLGSNADLTDKLKNDQIDASIMAVISKEPSMVVEKLFDDHLYFAAPAGSPYAAREAISIVELQKESFVALSDKFATSKALYEAFGRAGFEPRIAMKVEDIFSMMNLVVGGVGYALLPGRVRNLFGEQIQFIPLEDRFQVRQTIGLFYLRARERDPNLLALAAACRMAR